MINIPVDEVVRENQVGCDTVARNGKLIHRR